MANRMLLEDTLAVTGAARHAYAAAGGSGHPICNTGSAMDRSRFQRHRGFERRFHDEMQPSIRMDHQGEVVRLRAVVCPGNVKNALRVLKESVHWRTYRRRPADLEGEEEAQGA